MMSFMDIDEEVLVDLVVVNIVMISEFDLDDYEVDHDGVFMYLCSNYL